MYEIKVLDSEQFDEVARSDPRYSYVDESNMGFADRQRGVAYVRQSNLHDLNKYLISHELEELESDESTHEDPNGIRHKKGSSFFKHFFFPPSIITDKAKENKRKEQEAQAAQQQANVASFQQPQAPQFGGGGPLGQFSVSQPASPRIPDFAQGGGGGGLGVGGLGQQNQSIDPALAERLRGFFSGRIPF